MRTVPLIPGVVVRKSACAGWKCPFTCGELREILRAMLAEAGQEHARCELALLDDASMTRLNTSAAHCPGPTNILAFPTADGSSFPAATDFSTSLLGSLALSVDTLRRECFLYYQDAEEHCIRLLAHGLAHLLGFDHGPAMNALTNTLEAAAHARLQRYSHE